MKDNAFRNFAAPISEADLDTLERALERKLPLSFRKHYLCHNGGNPNHELFTADEVSEPVEVVGFYPIKYNTPAFDTENSLLLEHYQLLCSKGVIPSNLLPFAHDPGANLFALNLDDGSVVFFATDAFSPDLSQSANQASAQRKLAPSFAVFMESLKHNDNYDEAEWPD